MKLQFPFVQLPVSFDAAALAAELAGIDESEWIPHPQGFPGNSALPLISVNGELFADGVEGPMRPTPLLARLPLLRRALGRLGAVLGRTRLMRLSGNAEVTPHVDQGYYWAERMRVHVPIVTTPGVRFYCGDANIHMAAGECWIFDTWRMHRVHNDGAHSRVHLVVDTVGGDGLWQLVGAGRPHHASAPNWRPDAFSADAGTAEPALEFETFNLPRVMTPWELRSHIGFLFTEARPHPNLAQVQQAAMQFLKRWSALWAAHGDAESARALYEPVRDEFVSTVRSAARDVVLRNEVGLAHAMNAMVLRAALSGGIPAPIIPRAAANAPRERRDKVFGRPVFIVSSPRSGSTLLFETLSQAANVFTIGDESHALIEGVESLRPRDRGWDSNRLGVTDATPDVVEALRRRFREALVDRDGGQPYGEPLRMLEKTPKNALRVPFLARVFPEGVFVFLNRDVRETLASMLEAWQSGNFRTYPALPGWQGPAWSLLLVPGWRELIGKPLIEVVAAQWQATMQALLTDLAALPREQWLVARYDALLGDPDGEVRRLCAALDFTWDRPLGATLPPSRYTLSAPARDKWRKHEAEIESVLPRLADTIAAVERLAAR